MYFVVMLRCLLRQAIIVVTLGAFLGAGVVQITPIAQATPSAMTMNMAQDDGGPPQPCKHMTPGCMVDLGCVLLLGVPVPPVMLAVAELEWSQVTYLSSSPATSGLAPEPAIGPPISLV
ncbi:hypothetical protein [Limobrevibacterium gyesilva]|uniref:DUF2946 domain-containing protein n=1 Tax=Limobrevibacterium gyesilva TaxID=2991712 RepID=A0AA42CIX7_9PROT|nr:hypothetical protein [Limobrevibacterium gyesilva]MCW3476387.1 hypothetical protein [Limobrevibacterium gyesilva]